MGGLIRPLRYRTKGGTPYALMEGYPEFDFSEQVQAATEQYLIRSRDIVRFYLESFPLPVVINGVITRPLRRRMPGTALRTIHVRARPHTGQQAADPLGIDAGLTRSGVATMAQLDPIAGFDPHYVVEIQYEASLEPETLTHSVQIGGEFLNVNPNRTGVLDADATKKVDKVIELESAEGKRLVALDEDGNEIGDVEDNCDALMPIIKTIPRLEHSFHASYVLDPNWDVIVAMLGRVNEQRYDFLNNAHEETVMFMGVSGQRRFIWNGQDLRVQPYELTYRFSQRRIAEKIDGVERIFGHNHAYSPCKQKWVRLFRNGDTPLHEFDTDAVVEGFPALFNFESPGDRGEVTDPDPDADPFIL
jgi:hypothetical protein